MKILGRVFIVLTLIALVLMPVVGCIGPTGPPKQGDEEPIVLTPAGGERITYVRSPRIGNIAVQIRLPDKPRYPEGAPVVISISTFFTPLVGFYEGLDTTEIGAIYVTYLWPGREDPRTGSKSDGVDDYGGSVSLAALRAVIRFASGLIPNADGYYIDELLEVTPLTNNVGLYAFSHAGIVATNVIAHHGEDLPTVKYLVGRENPTIDKMYPLELGYFDDDRNPIYNPYYHPEGYTPKTISIDYSTVGWLQNDKYPDGRPYFAVPSGPDHVLGEKGPKMWGKRYYSVELTQALLDNGALTLETWPDDLATPQEVAEAWPYRTTVDNYSLLKTSAPELRVMLVFAKDDHVQPAKDKPHIHQAYDGFRETAGLWVRLNPDAIYVQSMIDIEEGIELPDNPANSEPNDWMDSRDWAHPYYPKMLHVFVPLAAVAEMADRVQANNWNIDLDKILFNVTQ